jgi:hypothetical protein
MPFILYFQCLFTNLLFSFSTMHIPYTRYHKSNASLDGLIGELRGKIDTIQVQAKTKRMTLNNNYLRI